jgi:hypothetical protein
MKMSDIQGIARERGVTPGRLAKVDLVRTLQQAEGNADCFQAGQVDSCGQEGCLWRAACA